MPEFFREEHLNIDGMNSKNLFFWKNQFRSSKMSNLYMDSFDDFKYKMKS